MRFALDLPEPGAGDVDVRELTVSIAGSEPVVYTLPGAVLTTEADEEIVLLAQVGDSVTGTLVDVDTANNRSIPREFSFIVVDDIAPPQPGEVGIRNLGE